MNKKKICIYAGVFVVSLVSAIAIVSTCIRSKAAVPWEVLVSGESNVNVYAAQYLLKNKGISVTVDGEYSSDVAKKVKDYQTKNDLIIDGMIGVQTWSSLIEDVKSGSSGDEVRALQYLLSNKSSYMVDVTGTYDSKTKEAIKSFNVQNHLEGGAVADYETWKCLLQEGLGMSDETADWYYPLKGGATEKCMSSDNYFGASRSDGRIHAGIDFHAPAGRAVIAMDDGEVLDNYLFYEGTYAVEIKHSNGIVARYGEITGCVKRGDSVKKGQVIGYVKTSNIDTSMLHLELYAGTANGSLSQNSNNSYTYVTDAKYKRRSDLIDPSFAAMRKIIY